MQNELSYYYLNNYYYYNRNRTVILYTPPIHSSSTTGEYPLRPYYADPDSASPVPATASRVYYFLYYYKF